MFLRHTGKKIQKEFPDRFVFKNLKFSKLDNLKLKNENIKAIVFDLGYSLTQIKDLKKGLSFNSQGELNMMMGLNNFSANEVVNNLDGKEIEKILKYFGDEKDAKLISKNIVKKRKLKKIDTQELVKIIEQSKKRKNYNTHFATKTFQALRIFVNNEISELINGLTQSAKVLKKDGILAVVTFHSIEDKIVKFFFKHYSEERNSSRYMPNKEVSEKCFKIIDKKPILPGLKEISQNPPSRSAKLRYGIKINHKCNFNDLWEKFKYLTDVEELK